MKKRNATDSPKQQTTMQQTSLPQHFRRVKPRLAAKDGPDGRPANAGEATP
jgi:hypothetical protein